jgi:hypothetical protein
MWSRQCGSGHDGRAVTMKNVVVLKDDKGKIIGPESMTDVTSL